MAMFDPAASLSLVAPTVATRSISFENPTGARGAGGAAAGGRKGAPYRVLGAGERVVLADIEGPGTIRHVWMTFPPAEPEVMRAEVIEVFYDGAPEPSVSVPAVDFFGVPWGRPVHLTTALSAINEGRGFNSYLPMPFRRSVRVELVNAADRAAYLYFQIDYTLEPDLPAAAGYLHAAFRRENPTRLRRDFVIADGLRGPGRFVGCVVGVRVLDGGQWYGEGEVKVYLDGDTDLPTICGTGLEDYVGSAWGMGVHQTLYAGAPLEVRDPEGGPNPDFVGFYRWHVPDPIMFARDLRVTIQQIGYEVFRAGDEDRMAAQQPAGDGWHRPDRGDVIGMGIAERVDDYCAVAYVMCAEPQPVPRLDVAAAVVDIGRRPYETA
jgi:D-arabinan exo alpha-(1,3)/(1,5)-arabinofuranosidase (non-reducing end)